MTSVPQPHATGAAPVSLGWASVFASDDLSERERYDAWRGTNVANLSTRYDTAPREPFAVEMKWLDLGTLGLGQARITAQDWTRSRLHAARDHSDDLVVNVRHVGAAYGDMDGRQAVAPAGSILLSDMARPQHHFSEASVSTGFSLPRAVAERFLPSVRGLHGHVVAPDQAALLVSHLAMLERQAAQLPAHCGPMVAQTVLDLLAVSVAASLGTVPVDADQHDRGLGVQLRAEIERNLGSPSLNTARLARTLGVSRSTLYRLLRDEGGVQAYIRTRRLDRIAETLRAPGDRRTIAALAERWGFCDAAYLGRAFREVYGVTPGDYRGLHASGDAPPAR
ncbi:helix-turn-helix domain-containing protein [Sphingomonas sp. RP10(2022)]|uniref:Helix-turn-helix domain-containing protein n=1 Tax=Sphingomonas liriopis TaxID=2949094 RepID=A0A9X2KQ44_9SPHN|nr:helix-turn-helix domain-containing protein [Sphingomonas liriopis]MCP3734590.1 helix-turn-helix domain-containing protein [Sphingomonas liriopis]